MKHSVPHDLEIDIARLATDAALNSYRERFSASIGQSDAKRSL